MATSPKATAGARPKNTLSAIRSATRPTGIPSFA